MTNLEHFKRTINVDNICDKIHCCECPVFNLNEDHKKKVCTERLKEWCKKEYRKEKK